MKRKKQLEKIKVDRKILEGLREGKSITSLTKITGKGKGYVIKIKDLSLEYGFIEPLSEGSKAYKATEKNIPPFPEALFPLKDGRSEKLIETDIYLEPHKNWITERLENGWCPQTVFEELTSPLPRANFYRYLHRHNLMNKSIFKNITEIIHAPGECLQVDWGKLTDVYDPIISKKKPVWMFVGTLGHSRYRMVRIVEKCNYETTINALISMFEELGGAPKKVVSDNPKVFVQKASKYEADINPAFERFASYYNFTIEALPPSSPELKGKVERIMNPIRRLFESYDFNNYDLSSANEHINNKLQLHNERKHSVHKMKPIEVLINEELPLFKSLPSIAYEVETIMYSTVRKDGYVRFLNKYYRVDERLKKEDVLLIGNSTHVNIYCQGRLLECYEIIKDRFQTKACKDHYREPWEKTLQDHGHYIDRATSIGEDVGRFINIVLSRGEGFVDTRVVWGILTLDKKFNKEDINKACRSAIELNQVSFRAVKKLLSITTQSKKKEKEVSIGEEFKTANGKFSRPISEYKNHLRLITNNNNNNNNNNIKGGKV